MIDKLSPIHPGEVLLEEFLKPMKMSQNRLDVAEDTLGARLEREVRPLSTAG